MIVDIQLYHDKMLYTAYCPLFLSVVMASQRHVWLRLHSESHCLHHWKCQQYPLLNVFSRVSSTTLPVSHLARVTSPLLVKGVQTASERHFWVFRLGRREIWLSRTLA